MEPELASVAGEEMSEALEQIDWKVFPKYGWFKGLRPRYERMSYAEKLEWQRHWRESRDWRTSDLCPRLSDVPFFNQWYRQASIAEVEIWEWEVTRTGIIKEWLRKITALMFGSNTHAWQVYYLIADVLSVPQTKRDEARVTAMRKTQLKQLVG
jgi:hypothetical protein